MTRPKQAFTAPEVSLAIVAVCLSGARQALPRLAVVAGNSKPERLRSVAMAGAGPHTAHTIKAMKQGADLDELELNKVSFVLRSIEIEDKTALIAKIYPESDSVYDLPTIDNGAKMYRLNLPVRASTELRLESQDKSFILHERESSLQYEREGNSSSF